MCAVPALWAGPGARLISAPQGWVQLGLSRGGLRAAFLPGVASPRAWASTQHGGGCRPSFWRERRGTRRALQGRF